MLKKQYIYLLSLILLLFAISFFKDDITPDYLNTPNAYFLKLTGSRLATLSAFSLFWFTAIVYSLAFAIVPYYILKTACNQQFAQYIFILLLLIMIVEYVLIFAANPKIDTAIIPKINRFYHSPIFTLFFLASYTINKRLKNDR